MRPARTLRAVRSVLLVAIAALPTLALASDYAPAVLSFKNGVPAELLAKTMQMAKAFFPLAVVLALLLEAYGGSAIHQKNYAGVVSRALLVIALLAVYRPLFGSIVRTSATIAERLTPQSSVSDIASMFVRSAEAEPKKELSTTAALLSGTKAAGGVLLDVLTTLLVLLGQAIHWIIKYLAAVLLAVLYIIGPLAIVFHIPGASDSAGRWFKSFLTIAMWPVVTALLLSLGAALMKAGNQTYFNDEYGTALASLVSTFFMVAMTLSAPSLASSLVGGAMQNLALAAGMDLKRQALSAASGVGAAAAAITTGATAAAATAGAIAQPVDPSMALKAMTQGGSYGASPSVPPESPSFEGPSSRASSHAPGPATAMAAASVPPSGEGPLLEIRRAAPPSGTEAAAAQNPGAPSGTAVTVPPAGEEPLSPGAAAFAQAQVLVETATLAAVASVPPGAPPSPDLQPSETPGSPRGLA